MCMPEFALGWNLGLTSVFLVPSVQHLLPLQQHGWVMVGLSDLCGFPAFMTL